MADTLARTFIAEKKLTDAQIKTLFSAPFEIVAAPGVGKLIFVESYYFILDTRNGVYASPGTLGIVESSQVGSYAGNIVPEEWLEAAALYAKADDVFGIATVGEGEVVNENKGVIIRQSTGNLTGGHANNYLIIRIYYRIYPIAATVTGNPVQD